MTINEIKEALLGKNISFFDGFNGTLNYFTIGHVVKDGTDVRVFHEKGNGFCIFIPIKYIKQLLETGEYREPNKIDGCFFEETWKLR